MPTAGTNDPPPDLVHGGRPTWELVLRLAWPVLVQQFLILSVGLYDQFLAGNNVPEDVAKHIPYQAAQTTANYIAWSISSCSVLVSVGATALVARFVGAGERASAVKTTNQSILLAFFFGIVLSPILFLLLPSGVGALGLHGETAESAVRFLQPIVVLVTCQLVTQAGIASLVGAGDTRTGPVVLSGVALLNIPLAWVCFHGLWNIPAMGFFGIGMGTALSHTAGCVAVLVILARGRYGLRLSLPLLLPDLKLIYRLLRVSVPASVDTLSIALCQLWFLTIVTSLGTVAAAAHGIAIRCESLGYMSGYAFATAAAALVGQNLGAARQPKQAAHAAWVALGLGCATMSLMGVMFFIFAPDMFRIFSPEKHQQPIVDAGVPILRLVTFAMPCLSSIIVLTGALRGAGDTRFPILLTWIGFLVIRMPLAFLLTRSVVDLGWVQIPGWNLGLIGAWIAMFADLTIRGFMFLGRFVSGRWKSVRV